MEITNYSSKLKINTGIYFSDNENIVSYPKSGNEKCFQIEENSFWFNHRNNCIVEGVLKYSPTSVFFDIGGGNGFVAKSLEDIGVNTVLIEPGVQGCLNAQKRGVENIICSTLENADFYEESISSIGLFDVVEHIENDFEFLKKIYSLLTNDGYVYITVPSYNFLWSHEDILAGHYRRYSRKEIEKVLRNVGFDIEYSTYIFSILTIPVFLFRVVPYRLFFKESPKNSDENKKEHERKKGFISNLLDRIWRFEIKMIKNSKKIITGGSCFIIAKKISK